MGVAVSAPDVWSFGREDLNTLRLDEWSGLDSCGGFFTNIWHVGSTYTQSLCNLTSSTARLHG